MRRLSVGTVFRRLLSAGDAPASPAQYSERSAVTRLLWEKRAVHGADRATRGRLLPLQEKTPADSFLQVVLPFSSDPMLRDEYVSPFGHVRIGRLLEDLDAFAGNVALEHASPSTPTLVTASIDVLDLVPKLVMPDRDLRITGNVTSVGRSSMEIRIDAYQDDSLILTTFFYFSARDPETNRATPINTLVPKTEQDKERMARGEENKRNRLEAKKRALHVQLPTVEEQGIIHRFFMENFTEKKAQSDAPVEIPMGKTHQRSLILCSHQQRNINSTIFGGYLCRKAFELGFSTAYIFSGKRPYFTALGDISFSYPVPIGAILDLRAAVVYTDANEIQTHVTARVHRPEEGTTIKTNDFAFTFALFDEDTMAPHKCGRKVRPETYAEAMSYIEGRRRLQRHRKID